MLLILTSGNMSQKDISSTIEKIVQSSAYPLQVLIVGVSDDKYEFVRSLIPESQEQMLESNF